MLSGIRTANDSILTSQLFPLFLPLKKKKELLTIQQKKKKVSMKHVTTIRCSTAYSSFHCINVNWFLNYPSEKEFTCPTVFLCSSHTRRILIFWWYFENKHFLPLRLVQLQSISSKSLIFSGVLQMQKLSSFIHLVKYEEKKTKH